MLIERNGDGKFYSLSGKSVLRTHEENSECIELGCCIHNPSDNMMNRDEWAYNWREDRGIMERLDPVYGIGHPDIDSMAFALRHEYEDSSLVHGCTIYNGYAICDPMAWE